ncbi:hypothetical protein BH11MYX1_BH11MYX1_36670 [soil metagenome]
MTGGSASKLTAAQRDALVYGAYKPSAATVGPVPEVTLEQFGTPATSTDFVITANNQVVQNLEIWGRVNIGTFTGVTIKNCIIHGTLLHGTDTSHVIAQGDNLRGATIRDSALVGRRVTMPASYNGVANPDAGKINLANEWSGGIRGGNYTMLRTEIRNTPDGLSLTAQIGHVTAKGCWIHDGWFNEWTPAQATPSSGGSAHFCPYSTGTEHYTHVDGIQFHRGKTYRFIGNERASRVICSIDRSAEADRRVTQWQPEHDARRTLRPARPVSPAPEATPAGLFQTFAGVALGRRRRLGVRLPRREGRELGRERRIANFQMIRVVERGLRWLRAGRCLGRAGSERQGERSDSNEMCDRHVSSR